MEYIKTLKVSRKPQVVKLNEKMNEAFPDTEMG